MQMKSYSLLIAILLVSLNLSAQECRFPFAKADQYSFGTIRIGDSVDKLPPNTKKSKNCEEKPEQKYFDCEYTDQKGISYLVYGDTITRKKIYDLSRYSGALIANLKALDSVHSAILKLKKLPSDFPTWWISSGDASEIYIGTDLCMKGTNGSEWAYQLEFDKRGRLTSISEESIWD
jgi:hypothetical protein